MSETGRVRLGLGTKVSYGLGAVAQGVGTVVLSAGLINFYLVSVVGLRPVLVGVVVLVSLVIDAVVDPAIGYCSDRLRSPWGRRHPFMYASALPIALGVVLLWRRPPGFSNDAMAIYALAMLVLVRLAGGLYQIPSDALAPELAPDYHERTGLISWRWFFGLLAGVGLGVVAYAVYLRKDASHPLGQYDPAAYANFGVLAAIVALVAILVSAAATHRFIPRLARPTARSQTLAQALREIVTVLANPSLIAIMVSGVVSGVASGISDSIGPFMNYYFWGLTPQVAGVLVAFAAPAAMLGLVLAPVLSRALDKKRTMISVFALSMFAGVIPVSLRLLGLLPPNGTPWIPVLLVGDLIIAGSLALTGAVLMGSMVADVVEDSAARIGVRSEGLLFAARGLLPKITVGVGGLIGNLMLEFVRFPAANETGKAVTVAPAIMRNLALVSLPAGVVLNLIAISVLALYRIDRGTHEANLETLRLAAALAGEPDPDSRPG
ncbi:MAG TPA: MFS transporter [Caulobacteraceae bacterium]|nr:MFS transporter [Caulobacteraceae bacterium]